MLFHRHIYRLWLSADGNFSAVKKKKQDDPDDLSLGDGHTYFAEDSTYKTYLGKVGETQEVHPLSNIYLRR